MASASTVSNFCLTAVLKVVFGMLPQVDLVAQDNERLYRYVSRFVLMHKTHGCKLLNYTAAFSLLTLQELATAILPNRKQTASKMNLLQKLLF